VELAELAGRDTTPDAAMIQKMAGNKGVLGSGGRRGSCGCGGRGGSVSFEPGRRGVYEKKAASLGQRPWSS
jgi:hypothetical protein